MTYSFCALRHESVVCCVEASASVQIGILISDLPRKYPPTENLRIHVTSLRTPGRSLSRYGDNLFKRERPGVKLGKVRSVHLLAYLTGCVSLELDEIRSNPC